MSDDICEKCDGASPARTCEDCLIMVCGDCPCECLGPGGMTHIDIDNPACAACGDLATQNCKTCGVNLCGKAGTLDLARGSETAAKLTCPICGRGML